MLRLKIKEYIDGEFQYIGSFVLRDGAKKIEIVDVPPEGMKYMQEMLAERVYGRTPKGERTKLVTAEENPVEWIYGMVVEYQGMYVHAAIEGEDEGARPEHAEGWEEPATEIE